MKYSTETEFDELFLDKKVTKILISSEINSLRTAENCIF